MLSKSYVIFPVETERLSEGGSSAVLLINGNATDAQSSDEQEENKRGNQVC